MSHDDLLKESRRDRRIRDRRRILAMLERRSSRFRSALLDVPMRGHSGLLVVGREADRWYARKFYSARKQCRSVCCGNPRRFHRVGTAREGRAELDAKEQLEESGLRHKPGRFRIRS